ncbi:hypothetical protein P7K49_023914 [Saguinus oedipus]|uniref:Uncharacterized protein n=1 Tax=Saguinus oedipus TaxID=9490 RepID=A0ABQ9UN24_SAGOE|nr:hypothetical protein P7K49_023914 [Saguinus oedipus]
MSYPGYPPTGYPPFPGYPPAAAFLRWGQVPTHKCQVVAIQELEATLRLEVIQPLEAILVPHSQGELHPIPEAMDLESHQVEQAFLAIHSHLHSLMEVVRHRSHYLQEGWNQVGIKEEYQKSELLVADCAEKSLLEF